MCFRIYAKKIFVNEIKIPWLELYSLKLNWTQDAVIEPLFFACKKILQGSIGILSLWIIFAPKRSLNASCNCFRLFTWALMLRTSLLLDNYKWINIASPLYYSPASVPRCCPSFSSLLVCYQLPPHPSCFSQYVSQHHQIP